MIHRAIVRWVAASWVLLDIALRHASMMRWNAARWASYGLAELASLAGLCVAFWSCTALVRKRPTLGKLALGLWSLLMGVWFVMALVTHDVMGAYPTWSDLAFVFYEGRHVAETWGLLQGYFTAPVLGALLLAPLALHFVLRRRIDPQARLPPAAVRAGCALALLGLLFARARIDDGVALSPASSMLVSTVQLVSYATRRTRGKLEASERSLPPPLAPAVTRPNVLVLLEESLSRKRMGVYGYEHDTTPRLTAWRQADARQLYVFEHATANASNTSIAVPSLLTGLPPDASWQQFHRQPLAWHYARAAGYRTFLLSAQSFRYAGFDRYFLSSPPDEVFTAEPHLVELANGGGMDDELFEPRVHAALERALASGKPFFGVVQLNATHHPFLARPTDLAKVGDSRLARYQSATRIVDRVLVRTLEWLAARGVLDDTLVLVTSDHGETLGEHKPHRTQSYYDEVTGIPLLVRAPASLLRARPEIAAALELNRTRRVQNLDVLPTALDAIGVLRDPKLRPFVAAFGGQSLLAPVPEARTILMMNNNAIRTWANEGFGLAHRQLKYMFSERGGDLLFDLAADPNEQRNLYDPARPPDWVGAALRQHPALCALRARHCEPDAGCIPFACE